MSLIDKPNANYLSVVERFFLSLRGSGLALSATDYHLIHQWESCGVPLGQLCRAIEKGVTEVQRNHRRPYPPRLSLSSLQPVIDQEIRRQPR